MEKKKEEPKENRFTYSDDTGLKVLSEKDIIEGIGKNKEDKIEKSEEIKTGYEKWL